MERGGACWGWWRRGGWRCCWGGKGWSLSKGSARVVVLLSKGRERAVPLLSTGRERVALLLSKVRERGVVLLFKGQARGALLLGKEREGGGLLLSKEREREVVVLAQRRERSMVLLLSREVSSPGVRGRKRFWVTLWEEEEGWWMERMLGLRQMGKENLLGEGKAKEKQLLLCPSPLLLLQKPTGRALLQRLLRGTARVQRQVAQGFLAQRGTGRLR